MKREDFIQAVKDAGWKDFGDSDYSGISGLWARIFPSSVAMEQEIESLKEELRDLINITKSSADNCE